MQPKAGEHRSTLEVPAIMVTSILLQVCSPAELFHGSCMFLHLFYNEPDLLVLQNELLYSQVSSEDLCLLGTSSSKQGILWYTFQRSSGRRQASVTPMVENYVVRW